MDLHQYLQALRKFWWVVAVATLLGATYGLYTVSQSVTEHRSSVTFFVVTAPGDSGLSAAVQGDQFAQRRVNSYVALLSTDRLATMVAERPEVDLEPGEVRQMISASGDLDTVLLTASVTSTDRALAQTVAEGVAEELVVLVDELERTGDAPPAVNLEVVSGPSVREVPARTAVRVGIPAAFALFLGLGVALLLELRDNTVSAEDELRTLAAGPILAKIPFDRRVRAEPLVVDLDPTSSFAESIRHLRTNLQFLNVERDVKVLAVTSSVAEEGKSITSANLAVGFNLANQRTLVIEADLRRPKVAEYFGMQGRRGLTEYLAGWASLEQVLVPWGGRDLSVLPAGHLPPNPSELLGSEPMRRLVDTLRHRFDVIVIDTPPLLPVSDGAVAASLADGVVLTVRSGRTTRHQVEQSARALEVVSAPLLGIAMTMASPSGSTEYTYGQPVPTGWRKAQRTLRSMVSGNGAPTADGRGEASGSSRPAAGAPPSSDR